ncbi:MAG: sulfite exporter TauE/SafE family protein [Pyrinomonadaceae bacterium]
MSVPLFILILLFFVTSAIGVVTGSNSLITVPVMFQFGIDEKVAVATNMFGLIFMSVGGSIPFIRQGRIDYRKIWPLAVLTLVGSAVGAALVGVITNTGMKLVVSIAMIAVAAFIIWGRNGTGEANRTEANAPLVYALAFALAIYGGLYSGGYVTMLTAVLVAFFAMPFGEAVGATKLLNVFSSAIATIVFIWQRLIDYRLGVILAVTMFVGAYIGAHYASRMNETWLRRIFLATVILLALKTLFDLSGPFILRAA